MTIQLAHAYRLNSDFKGAELYYKRSVDNKVKDALYYYGITLMALKKYQEALNALETYVTTKRNPVSLWCKLFSIMR